MSVEHRYDLGNPFAVLQLPHIVAIIGIALVAFIGAARLVANWYDIERFDDPNTPDAAEGQGAKSWKISDGLFYILAFAPFGKTKKVISQDGISHVLEIGRLLKLFERHSMDNKGMALGISFGG